MPSPARSPSPALTFRHGRFCESNTLSLWPAPAHSPRPHPPNPTGWHGGRADGADHRGPRDKGASSVESEQGVHHQPTLPCPCSCVANWALLNVSPHTRRSLCALPPLTNGGLNNNIAHDVPRTRCGVFILSRISLAVISVHHQPLFASRIACPLTMGTRRAHVHSIPSPTSLRSRRSCSLTGLLHLLAHDRHPPSHT
jgi:hypothetical protein